MSNDDHDLTDDDGAAGGKRDLLAIYDNVRADIKATDETSFRLLAAVPIASTLISGSLSVIGAPEEGSAISAIVLVGVSAAGVLITYGFFRWELRNIQKCNWLISRAARLEKAIFADGPSALHFWGIAKKHEVEAESLKEIVNAPLSLCTIRSWGKTEATKLIYAGALLVWVVPLSIGLWCLLGIALSD